MKPSYKTNDPKGWCGDPRRGAALGRGQIIRVEKDYNGKIYLRMIPLNSGGYDSNGTYFGLGAPIYWAANEEGTVDFVFRVTKEMQQSIACPEALYFRFNRIRAAAKKHVLTILPKASFFQ